MRSLLLDPRIRLFDVDMHGLENVKPLFTPDMFIFFDRYADGDDYHDPNNIARFRTILTALREKKDLCISFTSGQQSQPSLVVKCADWQTDFQAKPGGKNGVKTCAEIYSALP